MALKPIDLQVLFSRLNELSREQAAQKELPVHQQTVQHTELLKQTDQKTHAVTQSSEVEQGETEKIREHGKGRGRRQRGKKNEQMQESSRETGSLEVVQDPALGKNIDITG